MKEIEAWTVLQIFFPLIVTLFAIWIFFNTPGLIGDSCSACAAYEAAHSIR